MRRWGAKVQIRYSGQRQGQPRACMPTIVKTSAANWKAVIRKTGFPTATKTFRLKRDAEDWARRTED